MNRCPHCGGTHGSDNHFCAVTGRPIDFGPRLLGQTILDRFKVVTILGEGPIGIVLEVEDIASGRRLAAKMLHPYFARNASAVGRFLSEAQRVGTLGCPYIAAVVETGRDTGAAPTVIRELMVGECLEARIERLGQLPITEAMRFAREIIIALGRAHESDVLNLDLSPADIFLSRQDGTEVVKIVDFGEAHLKATLQPEDGEDLPSRDYFAPEQRRKGWESDRRADLYAAGAILYEMVTGEVPARIPSPANSLRNDLDTRLAAVIHKALAALPDNRYQSAAEFLAAIDDVGRAGPGKPATQVAKPTPSASPAPAPVPPSAPVAAVSPVSAARPAIAQPEKIEKLPEQEPAEQPSVIVDMPEMEKRFPLLYSKKLRVAIAVVAAVIVVVVVAVVLGIGLGGKPAQKAAPPPPPANVTIEIKVVPPGASVTLDGRRIAGNPAKIEVAPDNQFHVVKARAEGYEPLERDVKFDASKAVTIELIEIVQPDSKPATDTGAEVAKPEEPTPEPEVVETPKTKPAPKVTPRPPAAKKPPAGDKPKQKKGGFSTSNPYG
ncbi:MAG: serine/threonine protein kinase [Deltaproteobacteria bacterium]|nr:serine/threonine protein kinase [Deltaproteobacteria bacterium]